MTNLQYNYNHYAERLEGELQEKMPLLRWRVLRFEGRIKYAPEEAWPSMLQLYQVQAIGEISERQFSACTMVDMFAPGRNWDERVRWLVEAMAYEIACAMVDWRPAE